MPKMQIDLFGLVQEQLNETLDVGKLDSRELGRVRDEAEGIQGDAENGLDESDRLDVGSIIQAVSEIESEMGTETFDEGVEMIRQNCFEDHARELAEETGSIDRDASWPMNCIDWEVAARRLKHDYSAVEIAGATYYYRG